MEDYSFEYLKIEQDNGVLIVTLNRPDRLNAVGGEMHQELEDLWTKLSRDTEMRAVVLTGAGRAFCAGGDVKGMAASSQLKRPVRVPTNAYHLVRNMLDVEQPIIGAINGPAAGLGATLALLCDIVVASEEARIGDTHVKAGLVAGDGGTVIWPMLIGVNRAKEMLMRGRMLKAGEAYDLGLVNHVVSADDLIPTALKLAHELADGPIWAIRWTKAAINKMLKQNMLLNLDSALACEGITFSSDDHKEAARAFAEKREPRFTGQ